MGGAHVAEHVGAGLVELGVQAGLGGAVAVPVHLRLVYQRLLPSLADAQMEGLLGASVQRPAAPPRDGLQRLLELGFRCLGFLTAARGFPCIFG